LHQKASKKEDLGGLKRGGEEKVAERKEIKRGATGLTRKPLAYSAKKTEGGKKNRPGLGGRGEKVQTFRGVLMKKQRGGRKLLSLRKIARHHAGRVRSWGGLLKRETEKKFSNA